MVCGFRLRLWEVTKLLLAFLLGFLLHLLLDLTMLPEPTDKLRQAESRTSPVPEKDIEAIGLEYQLREPFQPNTMYEILRYDYFNMSSIYNNFDDNPRTGLLGHQKADLLDITHQALALLNSAKQDVWRLSRIVNAYRRFDPLRGEEYFIDAALQKAKTNQIKETHRLHLVKPFAVAQLISDNVIDNSRLIHFILPLTTDMVRLEGFLKNFQYVCRALQEDMYLFLVLFVGPGKAEESRAKLMKDKAQQLSYVNRKAHVKVVLTQKDFSRGLAIDLAAASLPNDALLFFCDADVRFSSDFSTRCRNNAVLGKRVYYPMVFAQYDPEIVAKYSPQNSEKEDMFRISKYTGYWVHYGFGMACMYAQDYKSAGGFQLDIKGWGGEDVDLYKKHVKSALQVVRAADPGLIHVFHKKSCDPDLSAEQYRMCVGALAEGIGSKQQLGRMILDESEDPDDVGEKHPQDE